MGGGSKILHDNACMPCLLQEDGWKLSRTNYYQEGWLATANVRGVVGVTYTTSFCAGTQVSPQACLTMLPMLILREGFRQGIGAFS